MSDNRKVHRKALRAMKAVTAGAILFAGVACSNDDTDDPDWNVGENDTEADNAVADTGPECNAEESTDVCPDKCHMDDDVDCCEESGGFWEGDFCSVVVPGPFVPPAMPG